MGFFGYFLMAFCHLVNGIMVDVRNEANVMIFFLFVFQKGRNAYFCLLISAWINHLFGLKLASISMSWITCFPIFFHLYYIPTSFLPLCAFIHLELFSRFFYLFITFNPILWKDLHCLYFYYLLFTSGILTVTFTLMRMELRYGRFVHKPWYLTVFNCTKIPIGKILQLFFNYWVDF